MPSISNSVTPSISIPDTTRFVEVKQTWGGKWKLIPYLAPDRAVRGVAPHIGTAELSYVFGSINAEDKTTFADYTPLNLQDWYVRISIQNPGFSPQPVWYGIIVDSENTYDSQQQVLGVQKFQCRELGFLLHREYIYQAYANFAAKTKNPPGLLNDCPTFNEQHWKGNNGIQGNRSQDKAKVKGNSLYVFEPNGKKWSNLDIINYILPLFGPAAIQFKLKGQTIYLDQIQDIFECKNKSIWECLCHLIDLHRGFGFNIIVDDNTQTPYINVFTLTDYTITLGKFKLPANANAVAFTYPGVYPFTHATGEVPFCTTSSNAFDQLIVQGKNIKVVGTWAGADGNLIIGWNGKTQEEYLAGVSANDYLANDAMRANPRYENVFTRFIVPKNWRWTVGQGDGNGVLLNLSPTAKNDGNVDFSKPIVNYFNSQNEFERHLPFLQGMDYTVNPIVNNNVDNDEPDYVPMFAAIKDTRDGTLHTRDNKWHDVHKLHAANPMLHDMHVQPLDNELGIKMSAHPNHYMALDLWSSAAGASQTLPEFSYTTLLVTAMVETWQRQQIIMKNPTATENTKTKVLFVDNAEFWHCLPNAAIGIDKNGALQTIHPANRFVRNDLELLQAVSATASAWYFVKRQAVSIPIRQLGLFVALGSMLRSISTINGVEQVRTVVSSIEMDFKTNTTTIATAYNELDFASFARKFR
jgi:hypothetical protein